MTTGYPHDLATLQHAVQDSLASFYRIEHTTLQQATAAAAVSESIYWRAVADETRRVLDTLSFTLNLHGLGHFDPTKGDAA